MAFLADALGLRLGLCRGGGLGLGSGLGRGRVGTVKHSMLERQRVHHSKQSDEGDDFSEHYVSQWQTKALKGRECTDPADEIYCRASN